MGCNKKVDRGGVGGLGLWCFGDDYLRENEGYSYRIIHVRVYYNLLFNCSMIII